jgi:hypothetical protein
MIVGSFSTSISDFLICGIICLLFLQVVRGVPRSWRCPILFFLDTPPHSPITNEAFFVVKPSDEEARCDCPARYISLVVLLLSDSTLTAPAPMLLVIRSMGTAVGAQPQEEEVG